jgi:amidase
MDFADDDEAIASGLALQEATIAELGAAMAAGELTATALAGRYLDRIERLDRRGPALRSVIEVNPEAMDIAERLDRERRERGPRGPLHGIPVLLKDNIDTGDRQQTTAGSLALVGEPAPHDATVAARLREAGAVILGKANLSEWANFRSSHSTSGWSARGGQCRNPYALDRTPCGSSSGSAAAVSANLCAAAVGTETDGSIVCPASACGVVGIKPTVGLTSRAGVVPISHSQDTVGPHARTVADAAALLGAMVGVDPRDRATEAGEGRSFSDYTRFLDPSGLRGARIGVPRTTGFGTSPRVDAVMDEAIGAIREAGATVVDPADIPSQAQLGAPVEATVLLFEFRHDLNVYLGSRTGLPVRTLAEVIAFNVEHAAAELAWFGQERFELAEATTDLSDPKYLEALAQSHLLARERGIDAAMDEHRLDALIAPTGGPAWVMDPVCGDHFSVGSSTAAAQAGYPIVTVPAGLSSGLPVNVSFIGRAFSEPVLIRLAFAFEAATKARHRPRFLPTLGL